MILAAGLTPAWQQIVVLDALRVGEVNRAREVHWCASGKVLNVGRALHALKAPSQTLALVGGPPLEAIDREFSEAGIPHRWVTSAAPTRVCTTILDTAAGVTTELVENARPVSAAELAEFQRAFRELSSQADVLVLTGSLPAGTPVSYYKDLLDGYGGKVVMDASGPALLAALERKPFLVKPNREELSHTLGRELAQPADLRDAMHELCRRGAEWVVVSQGKEAVWVCHGTRIDQFAPPRVEVVNPIGSGDCLAAGIAAGIFAGKNVYEAVSLGMAAAVENVQQLLPARLDATRTAALAEAIRPEIAVEGAPKV